MPSLKQLNEAIESYRADHPDVLMTVVVDATFGHRIEQKEVAAFEKAIETNEFVAPPAGAVGRGDGFIISIAQKANASILSNDSYQEFHGEYAWLFDEGRLIGGKPVPHVGWVFVNRVPVRGPVSRRSVKEQKVVDKSPSRRRGPKRDADAPSISADGPMPVPTSLPPGAVMPGSRRTAKGQERGQHAEPAQEHGNQESGRQAAVKTTNDLLAFLSFVEHFPVGTAVTGVVETYSSHGAYVLIGDAHGYVPLRLMADPAPRSAREVMDLGETVTLVVSSFGAARRSIDLAVPSMAPVVVPPAPKARRGAKQAAATAEIEAAAIAAASPEEAAAVGSTPVAKASSGRKRAAKQQPQVAQAAATPPPTPEPAKRSGARGGAKRVAPAPAEVPVVSPPPARPAKVAKSAKPAKAAKSATPARAATKQAARRRGAVAVEPTPAAPADAATPPATKQGARRRPAKPPAGS